MHCIHLSSDYTVYIWDFEIRPAILIFFLKNFSLTIWKRSSSRSRQPESEVSKLNFRFLKNSWRSENGPKIAKLFLCLLDLCIFGLSGIFWKSKVKFWDLRLWFSWRTRRALSYGRKNQNYRPYFKVLAQIQYLNIKVESRKKWFPFIQ